MNIKSLFLSQIHFTVSNNKDNSQHNVAGNRHTRNKQAAYDTSTQSQNALNYWKTIHRACIASVMISAFSVPAQAQGFPSVFDLHDVNGTNGAVATIFQDSQDPNIIFVPNVSSVKMIGDINNDGIDDIAVASSMANPERRTGAGITYVVFGKNGGIANPIKLQIIDGTNGFSLIGASGDQSGTSVSGAGDINGDGIDDLIIGAPTNDAGGNENAGISYVVFGHAGSFQSVINLAILDGRNGFALIGVDRNEKSGTSVSGIGDINGDGLDDLAIGSPNLSDSTGLISVFFGHTGSFTPVFDLFDLDGTNGFTLIGEGTFQNTGIALSPAGDFNGDGIDDLLIGSSITTTFFAGGPGKAYVYFGHTGNFPSGLINLSTLDGTNGITINGLQDGDLAGRSVNKAGDVNGDGIDDIIIGARNTDFQGKDTAGAAFVVFGKSNGFTPAIELSTLSGSDGFSMFGVTAGDMFGDAVAGAGDFNGDGLADIIIGAPNGFLSGQKFDGANYVVFGKSNFSAILDITSLDGQNGFAIGGSDGSPFGASVFGAGDLNADGTDDIIFSGGPGDTDFSNLKLATTLYGVRSGSNGNPATTLFSSVLPAARAGFVGGQPITVFASVVNAGANAALNCTITIPSGSPVSLSYQPTNAANVPVGAANQLFTLSAGQLRSFILSFTPTNTSSGSDIFPNTVCDNASVGKIQGVNTVFLSIGNQPVPDILSIGATPSGNGIIAMSPGGSGFMAVSATNIGAGDSAGSANVAVRISVDSANAALPLLLQLCETDASSQCLNPPGTAPVDTIIGGGASFFAVFVTDQSNSGIPLDPANSRVFMRITDAGGTVRSVTSAAVTVATADPPETVTTPSKAPRASKGHKRASLRLPQDFN